MGNKKRAFSIDAENPLIGPNWTRAMRVSLKKTLSLHRRLLLVAP
jgi:hypothetical protein